MVDFVTNFFQSVWFGISLLSHLLHWEGLRIFNSGMISYFLGSPGIYGYGSKSTAQEIAVRFREESLEGCTAIVTGASSGLGLETAKALSLNGCRVIMAVRNIKKAENLLRTEFDRECSGLVSIEECDLSDLQSVQSFAKRMIREQCEVTLLFNNAGLGFCPSSSTKDGYELQFGTNFIGHALLTYLLIPLLDSNAKTILQENSQPQRRRRQKSRIVDVSSIAHAIIADDIRVKKKIDWMKVATSHQRMKKKNNNNNNKNEDESLMYYDSYDQYGYSKLANILHTRRVAREIESKNLSITINAVHPGTIMNTSFVRYRSNVGGYLLTWINRVFGKSPEQGAATQMLCAVHPHFDVVNGQYFQDCDVGFLSTLATDSSLEDSLFDFFNQQILPSQVRKLE